MISIGSFAAGVAAAQTVFVLLASRPAKPGTESLGMVLIAVLGLLFGVWTFISPHLLPWLDVQGGFYGLR